MQKKRKKLRFQILFSMTAVLVILVSLFLSVYNLSHVDIIYNNFQKETKHSQKIFHEHLRGNAEAMRGKIYLLQQDKTLLKFWQKKNINLLYQHSLPLFKTFKKEWNITHFYFINLDKSCALRVHHRQRNGDMIDRYTLKNAMTNKRPSWGIELGVFGTFALRVVVPWKIDNKIIGYIELGKEIEELPTKIKHLTGLNIILLINKNFINFKKWQEGQSILSRNDNWNQFSDHVVISSNTKVSSKLIVKKRKEIYRYKIDGKLFLQRSLPLADISGNKLGVIILLSDITHLDEKFWSRVYLTLSLSFILVSLLFIFYILLIKKMENDQFELIHKLFQHSKLTSLGRLVSGIAHEINNPLAIIYGNIESIKLFKGNFKIHEEKQFNKVVENQEYAVERISQIVKQLQKHVHINDDSESDIKIDEIISSSLILYGPALKKANIEIKVNQNTQGALFKANNSKISQMVIQLLINANDALETTESPAIIITTSTKNNVSWASTPL